MAPSINTFLEDYRNSEGLAVRYYLAIHKKISHEKIADFYVDMPVWAFTCHIQQL